MSNDLIKISLWKKIFQNADEKIHHNNQKNLTTLLKCNHLQYHSKKVEQGDAFIAISGNVVDGHDYIFEVISKAAIVIANDSNKFSLQLIKQYPNKIILVENTKKILSEFADSFYSSPSKKMTIIGITGTNGKTSTCEILKQIFTSLHFYCGVIGTNGIFIGNKFYPSENTTPIAIELQKNLHQMNREKIDFVFMEISSHALVEGRADHVHLDGVAFTNISSEHLDFHENLENYFQAKKKIFSLLVKSCKENKIALCCTESLTKNQQQEISKLKNLATVFFTKKNKEDNFDKNSFYYEISSNQQKSNYKLIEKGNVYSYETNLLGNHNGQNLTTALLFVKYLAETKKILTTENLLKSKILSKSLQNITIEGRLQKIANNIFIDYAHTPDALKKILESARFFSNGRVVTLFGCGGDRDKNKRSKMGEIASELADYNFITSDNPRTENPEKIIEDIIKNIQHKKNYNCIVDRKLAIQKAIDFIKEQDILLILGKGHENYQIINREKIPFDEKKIVEEILKN